MEQPTARTDGSSQHPVTAKRTRVRGEAIRDASGVLAHELRNPLSVMQTAIDVLASEGDCDLQSLEILRRQIHYMTQLVNNLADMTRGAYGKICVKEQPVQLQPLVDSVLESMQQTISSRRQSIETSIPDNPVWIDADFTHLTQILINLLSNASKYSDEGSIIRLIAQKDEASVVIRVIDQGDGIGAEDLPHIFEYFSQSKMAIDHAQGGLGIGLGLVRNLVEAHGGSVVVNSEGLGKGSEFVVRLNLGSAVVRQSTPSSHSVPIRNLNVLLVDDSRDSTYLLTALIKQLGAHSIRTACDGPTSLDVIVDFRPDLILLDLGLPGMSGLELARRFRGLDQAQNALIVALTGYDDDRLREEVLASGVDLYRLKPASIETIIEILEHPRLATTTRVE